MRKSPIIIGSILFLIGLVILAYDASVFYRYGFDLNDVAGISDDGVNFADWPTGETPLYAQVPAFIYGGFFWVAALAVINIWPRSETKLPMSELSRHGKYEETQIRQPGS